MKQFAILLCLPAAMTGCVHRPFMSFAGRAPIEFYQVERLVVGTQRREEVRRDLGTPDVIEPLQNDEEAWLYFDNSYPKTARLIATFSTKSSVLDSVSWTVRESDEEVRLSQLYKRYPEAKFKQWRPRWTRWKQKDLDQIFFEDDKRGMKILYRPSRDAVEAIILTGAK